MSTSTTCSKCGAINAQWAKFCASCGNPLATPPQPQIPTPPSQLQYGTQPVPPSPPPPWYTYSPPAAYEFQNRTAIDRTKTGLLLLIIGVLLRPVPFIGGIGTLLIFIGAILVILGREAFGSDHSRNTIWSIIIYVVGAAIAAIGGFLFGLELFTARLTNGSTSLSQALSSSFATLLVAISIGTAVTSIAYVLFTYAIQNQNGKTLLWIAYVANVTVTIVSSYFIFTLLPDAIARAVAGGTYNPGPLQDLQNQLQLLGLLNFIPAALFAAALYLAWSRIGRGELPAKPSTVPSSPAPTLPPSNSPPTYSVPSP